MVRNSASTLCRSTSMRNSKTALLVAWLVLAGPAAYAEPPNTQAALARAQSMLRQLNDAKQQLELDNAKLKASNAALEQQIRIAKLNVSARESDLAVHAKHAEQARSGLARIEKRKEQLTTRLEEVLLKYKDTARSLQQAEADKQDLQRDLTAMQRELADAEEKNRAMYATSREVLERFKHKSPWTTLLQKEPFTGIKQVEVESTVENFEHDMQEQLLDKNLGAGEPAPE